MYAPRFSVESQYLGAEKTTFTLAPPGKSCYNTRKHTGNTLSIMLDFITIHAHFMTSNNSLETVLLTEFLGDVGTELHAHASFAGAATGLILRIGPQHLHHETCLAGLSLVVSVQLADIVQGDIVIGEQAAMKDKILFADESGEGKGRETFRE